MAEGRWTTTTHDSNQTRHNAVWNVAAEQQDVADPVHSVDGFKHGD